MVYIIIFYLLLGFIFATYFVKSEATGLDGYGIIIFNLLICTIFYPIIIIIWVITIYLDWIER